MTDTLAALRPGLRVYVDQSEHPIHDDVQSMGARLMTEDGKTAEVQIAKTGDDLTVVIAGDNHMRRDRRGNWIITVTPTKKETE